VTELLVAIDREHTEPAVSNLAQRVAAHDRDPLLKIISGFFAILRGV
jgi:hypothetical protein